MLPRTTDLACRAVGYFSRNRGLIGQAEAFERTVKRANAFYSVHELAAAQRKYQQLLDVRTKILTRV